MKWPGWLNRTVVGAGLASFFGDLGYESVTVLLPSFLILLGAPVFAFGIIEGLSDGASSFVKLFSGYFADKLGRRREFALGGSVATAVFPAIVAIASSWYVVLAGRLAGWIGKGIRSPTRDAILSKSVETKDLGKAIGRVHSGNHFGGRPVSYTEHCLCRCIVSSGAARHPQRDAGHAGVGERPHRPRLRRGARSRHRAAAARAT